MDQITSMGASGMRSRIEALEMLANNLSNAGTAGYKADREFYGLYMSADVAESDHGQPPSPGTMPTVERNWIDLAQGTLTVTNNPLDLALDGPGFFAATSSGEAVFTRDGSMRVGADGILRTKEGYALQSSNPQTPQIRLPQPGEPFTIDAGGTVRQQNQPVGQLRIVDFPKREAIEKRGSNYFRLVDPKLPPAPAAAAVHQGKVETSNVGPAESAVRLVTVLRQFEMLTKAMAIGGEMNRRAIEEVARVS